MELIRPGSAPEFPEGFISNPVPPERRVQDRDAYVAQFRSLPQGIRLRYLAGDIFPSLKWMKQRHNCGTLKALAPLPEADWEGVMDINGATAQGRNGVMVLCYRLKEIKGDRVKATDFRLKLIADS